MGKFTPKKIAVLTSLFGKEDLRSLNEWELSYGVDYFAFVNREHDASYGWKQVVSPEFSHHEKWSNRRNAKIYKILPHLFLPDYDVYVWVDSNHILIKDPKVMCDHLGDHDIMVFKHWERNCAYEEAKAVSSANIDDHNLINDQLEFFQSKEFPRNYGLYELPCFIERNNRTTMKMSLMWWEMICRFTSRDQISFPYVKWKMNELKIKALASGANCTPLCSMQKALEGKNSGNPFFFASGLLNSNPYPNPKIISTEGSFNEKIRWSLKSDRNALKKLCSDKLRVKDYIKEKIGDGFIPKTLVIADDYKNLSKKITEDSSHPTDYIIKSNNDSGNSILVKNKKFEKEKIRRLEYHKNFPYGVEKGEWFYGDIEYQCFTEGFIGENLIDYKFHCSAGEPRFCELFWDRHFGSYSDTKEVCVSLAGECYGFHFDLNYQLVKKFEKPKNWERMKEIATILCQDFDYVRVDMYNTNIKDDTEKSIFVGELTFAPRAGRYKGEGQVEAGKLLTGLSF